MSEPLYRQVGKKRVLLSAAEAAAVRAEWLAGAEADLRAALRARLAVEVERTVRRTAWAAIAADPARTAEERAVAAEEAGR